VCLDRDNEGLGIHRIRDFNLSLLGKWHWTMRVDQRVMVKVFVARYGWEGGCVKEGGKNLYVRWEGCYGG